MTPLARLARERWWVWALPLVFAAVGIGLLSNYLMALSGEGRSLLANVGRTEVELAELEAKSRRLEVRIEAMRSNQELIDQLYDERLSTEARRLTSILAEVKKLATQSGLKPTAMNYGENSFEDHGLKSKSFSFGVHGTYAQLRQLIHHLEQSESFLTLEQIGLSQVGGKEQELRINLRLSTLFTREGPS